MIAILSSVCKWFDEFAKRVLWKELCNARAPKMMKDLHCDGRHIVDGNWKALGKVLISCAGWPSGDLFSNIHDLVLGHFVYKTHFLGHWGRAYWRHSAGLKGHVNGVRVAQNMRNKHASCFPNNMAQTLFFEMGGSNT
jgi:hypothetical protein